MKVDVVCAGDPFLDLIFRGLAALPAPGEEQLARRLVVVPGGIANVAYALRRLDLSAVVCGPVGTDPAGRLLGQLMAEAGVPWLGRASDATAVSAVLPAAGDRCQATFMPPPTVDVDTLAGITARAIVVDLPSLPLLPRHPRIYAVVGDPEVDMMIGRLPESLADVHALLLNEREVKRLTGIADVRQAGGDLAGRGTTVVVTRGAGGATAFEPAGRVVEVRAPLAEVEDPTGAGDLFAAAYIWADLAGRPADVRLELAARYASHSLARATDRMKGLTLREFEDLEG